MTRRLLDNKVLSDGEPRHFRSWDFPALPRLDTHHPFNQAIYRRQKAYAPPIRGRRGLQLLLHVLRSR